VDALFEADGKRGGAFSWSITFVILGTLLSLIFLPMAWVGIRTVEGFSFGSPWIYVTTLAASVGFGVWSWGRDTVRIRVVPDASGLRLVVTGPAVDLDLPLARGLARWVSYREGPHVGADQLVQYNVVLVGTDGRKIGFWLLAGARGSEPEDWPAQEYHVSGCDAVFFCPGITTLAKVVQEAAPPPPIEAPGEARPRTPRDPPSRGPKAIPLVMAALLLVSGVLKWEWEKDAPKRRLRELEDAARFREDMEKSLAAGRERDAKAAPFLQSIPTAYPWEEVEPGTTLCLIAEVTKDGEDLGHTVLIYRLEKRDAESASVEVVIGESRKLSIALLGSSTALEPEHDERQAGERHARSVVRVEGRDVVRETWTTSGDLAPARVALEWSGAHAETRTIRATK
jgi:hypothetical protein